MAGVFHRWRYLEEFEDVRNPGELGRTVLGLTVKAFWQRLARGQSDLVRARTAAVERDRPVPAYRELRIVGRSWGWLELQVYPPDGPELYGIVGVGAAAPGSRPTVRDGRESPSPCLVGSGDRVGRRRRRGLRRAGRLLGRCPGARRRRGGGGGRCRGRRRSPDGAARPPAAEQLSPAHRR